jgi:hypothetical protein
MLYKTSKNNDFEVARLQKNSKEFFGDPPKMESG